MAFTFIKPRPSLLLYPVTLILCMALELLKEDDSDELLNEELVLPWQTNLAEKTRAASCVLGPRQPGTTENVLPDI